MADERDELIAKLLKENAELQQRLGNQGTVSQSGSGAAATDGGIAAGAGGAAVQNLHGHAFLNSTVTFVEGRHSDPRTGTAGLRQRYLSRLNLRCRALPLAAMGGDAAPQKALTLDQVYIDLNTTLLLPEKVLQKIRDAEFTNWSQLKGRLEQQVPDRPSEERPVVAGRLAAEEESSPLPVLEALRLTPHMVLLGDPGSGKTSFVDIIVSRQALAIPLPGVSTDLLPVLVTLRDLALHLTKVNLDSLPPATHDDALAEAVCEQMVADLAGLDCVDFADELRRCLEMQHCLVVFDGLDEVPPSLRAIVRRSVLAAVARYAPPRVIVTCRKRSYEGEVVLSGFEVFTLAPFSDEQIENFARAWYTAQRELGRVDSTQAEHKAQDLAQAALAQQLHELAENPMLLTTMALIHQQDVGLPKERVRLYSKAVEVLLLRWQNRYVSRDELAEFLRNDLRVRAVMERLAYEAHGSKNPREGDEAADLSRLRAREILEEYLDDANQARDFLNYVDQRAGLLVGRGGKSDRPAEYSFPHRTFQEYLAGCHMLIGEDRERVEQFYARAAEGDRWNLVAQLSAEELLFNTRDGDRRLLHLAYNLLPQRVDSQQTQRATLWSGQMAVLAGRKAIERDTSSPNGGADYLQRLRSQLVVLLGGTLSTSERCQGGDVLAYLGDPRFRADTWFLPDEPLLGFIEIPAGPFVMGSDKKRDEQAYDEGVPEHTLTLSSYYIARYPVTVAQFHSFVETSRHQHADEASVSGLANHPVVRVTWHDAMAYCRWLTECLCKWQGTPEPLATLLRKEGWQVTLPSEAEWEKAARGTDGRVYPWGNDWREDHANTMEVQIGHLSTVGCFPQGASPYGCQDMAGNVWEWTRSLWGKDGEKPDFRYPYNLTDGREQLGAPDEILRVLRGGSYWYSQRSARCAARSRDNPYLRYDYSGFRLVVRR